MFNYLHFSLRQGIFNEIIEIEQFHSYMTIQSNFIEIHSLPLMFHSLGSTAKILMSYLQFTVFLGDFRFRWSEAMSYMFNTMGSSNLAMEMAFLNCINHFDYHMRYIVFCIIPIIVLLIMVSIFLICHQCNKSGSKSCKTALFFFLLFVAVLLL